MGTVVVAAGGHAAHGAGLAGGAVAGRLALRRGAVLGQHAAQHRRHFRNLIAGEDALASGFRAVAQHRDVLLQSARGQRQIGAGKLQRRHRQPVAVGQRRSADGLVQVGGGELADGLARQPTARVVAEASALQGVEDGVRRQFKGHLGDPHLARLGENPRHGDGAAVERIFDRLAADAQIARRRVHFRFRRVEAALQGGQHRQRLDRGARLVDIGDGAVAHAGRTAPGPVVGIEGRLVGERQQAAVGGVQHHQRTGGCAVMLHCGLQLAVGEKLQAQIQGEVQILAALRGAQIGEVAQGAAGAVAQHPLGAGRAGQRGVVGQFDALLAHVVDVRAADDVGRGLPGRVEAMRRAADVDAVDAECGDLLGDVRRHPPRQVGEAPTCNGGTPRKDFRRRAQGIAEPRQVAAREARQLRVGPHVVHRCADRERLAVAVEDHAAMHRHVHHAHRARFALVAQEVALGGQRQEAAAHRQAAKGQQEHGQHHVMAPRPARLASRVALAPLLHSAAVVASNTFTTSSGKSMPSWLRAMGSTVW